MLAVVPGAQPRPGRAAPRLVKPPARAGRAGPATRASWRTLRVEVRTPGQLTGGAVLLGRRAGHR
eukprot:1218626-Alexandrium_andersonii.AAC.1